MPPEPTHDATLVDQAIGLRTRTAEAALERLRSADLRLDAAQQAEIRRATSSASTAELIAQGRRAMMYAAGASLVILAVGVAAWLIEPGAAGAPAVERLAGAVRPEVTLPPGREDIIVSDYVIFTQAARSIGGREFLIEAGHRYRDERSGSFASAWCYTRGEIGGVSYWLDLGTLQPGDDPVPASAEQDGTRDAMGLTDAEAGEMFRACPWLSVAPAPDAPSATHASAAASSGPPHA